MTVSDGGSRSALYKALSNPNEDFSWQKQANCRGVNPDLFYPRRGDNATEARKVCAACAVRQDCLDYAVRANEEFGLWGGLYPKERRRIRVSQPAATRVAAAVEAPQYRRGLKRCPKCDLYMRTEQFSHDSTRSDGLAGECRSCKTRREMDRQQRRKAAS